MFVDWACSIAQIMLINVVLSGDNALVVALAANGLTPEKRRGALFWGIVLAVGFRMVLTLAVSCILVLPGLRTFGAVLLAYIACKLIREQADRAADAPRNTTSTGTAIGRIALADVVMSLDNVIAVAGVAQADSVRLFLGLAFSIAMMLALSTAILGVMSRLRWMAYLGTGVLALGAANMMADELDAATQWSVAASEHASTVVPGVWSLRLALVVFCLTSKYWWPKRHRNGAAQTVAEGSSAWCRDVVQAESGRYAA